MCGWIFSFLVIPHAVFNSVSFYFQPLISLPPLRQPAPDRQYLLSCVSLLEPLLRSWRRHPLVLVPIPIFLLCLPFLDLASLDLIPSPGNDALRLIRRRATTDSSFPSTYIPGQFFHQPLSSTALSSTVVSSTALSSTAIFSTAIFSPALSNLTQENNSLFAP